MWLQLALYTIVAAYPDQPQLTFEDFYYSGKLAYTSKDWQQCISYMRRTIEDFRYIEDELLFCRKKCNQQVESPDAEAFSQYVYEAQQTLCLLRCKRERLTEQHPGIKKMSVYFDVKERKPFEYLHICHWNVGEIQKAVNAAFTFLVANPDHADVLHALNFYMESEGFQHEWLADELALKHEASFMSGVEAYLDSDWSKCSNDLELAIEKIYQEEESCRLQCNDKLDWSGVDGNPELSAVVTSIRSSVTRCAHNCLLRLGVINGHNIGNPLAMASEYLHVCYFQQMRGADAMRAVANYLLFDDNPTMRRNRNFYSGYYKKDELFLPDSTLLEFHRKRVIEERFLEFVEERIRYVDNEFPAENAADRKRLQLDVWQADDFDYRSAGRFLAEGECKLLRTPVQTPTTKLLLEELTKRSRRLFPTVEKTATVSCGPAREADCARPFVVSVDEARCSEWLGRQFSGCALVVCA